MIEPEPYYGLKGRPFEKSISPKDLFMSESLKELAARLQYLKDTRGLMLLTGEPGVGKTVALRAFLDALNPNLFLPVYTPLSTVNVLDFYRQPNALLGGTSKFRKNDLFLSIQHHLRIPTQIDHLFRRKSITDSDLNRSPIPT